MLLTPDNLTITATGQIHANGSNGATGAEESLTGSGGGGAGGDIWFETGGIWTNDGLVTAEGGAGGEGCCATTYSTVTGSYWGPAAFGGSGSGGYIDIDPSEIVNNGTIDVADGSGGSANGGLVGLDGLAVTGRGQITGVGVPEPDFWAQICLMCWVAAGVLAALGFPRRKRRCSS